MSWSREHQGDAIRLLPRQMSLVMTLPRHLCLIININNYVYSRSLAMGSTSRSISLILLVHLFMLVRFTGIRAITTAYTTSYMPQLTLTGAKGSSSNTLSLGKEPVKEQRRPMTKSPAKPKGQPAANALKRSHSPDGTGGVAGAGADQKRHKNAYVQKGRIASEEVGQKANDDPFLAQLERLMESQREWNVDEGEAVVFWMRMVDVRIDDSRGLEAASSFARQQGLPLVVLFVFSPGDLKMHDISTRRIDFVLRNLTKLQGELKNLNIPLHVISHPKRREIPSHLINSVLPNTLKAKHVFANISYEVDELRRDIACAVEGKEKGVKFEFVHDRLVVKPGTCKTKQGKPYGVFSPYQRTWAALVTSDKSYLMESPRPSPNPTTMPVWCTELLDQTPVPESVEGFECKDHSRMSELWPEGTDTAMRVLDRFLKTKARASQIALVSPLSEGVVEDPKHSRIAEYGDGRNVVDKDSSSRISPYLSSGVVSPRMVLNAAAKATKGKLEFGRDTGLGMWVQEVSWRDFYTTVMATWPSVGMGRPYLEKFQDVQWEVNEEHLQAWKDGRTGVPIVDAAMRACKEHGWMHNRLRMIVASYLTKNLLVDWRLGEKYFMEILVDGEHTANNGGWQWVASTGTDPQPYFRVFNCTSQSEKCDPTGAYIRQWVPELKHIKDKTIHEPAQRMTAQAFKATGYLKPIVDHKVTRERALYRYKNVGMK